MSLIEWLDRNKAKFGSEYEIMFAQMVLPLVPELNLDFVSVQHPFQDMDHKQRYCDFVIQEGENVRIAIEIDGYDKRGTGMGMSHDDFIDWQRRQATLTSQGWYVLRFANRDVRDEPKRCAEHISLLLKHSRGKYQNNKLSLEEMRRLEALTKLQSDTIERLNKKTSIAKRSASALVVFILLFGVILFWQKNSSSSDHQAQLAAANKSFAVSSPSFAVKESTQSVVGLNCDNPISWRYTSQYIGRTVALVGPVMKITSRQDVKGEPTWIDVGAVYPDVRRLTLVIWGGDKANFSVLKSEQVEGKTICVTGKVEIYKGMPQVELRKSSQLVVMPKQ